MKKISQYAIAAAVLIVLIIAGFTYLQYRKNYPSTNDAYVHAHLIYISPQISGKVKAIHVNDLQKVKKGQLLFEVDPQPFQIALQKAKAGLLEVESQLKTATNNVAVAKADTIKSHAQLVLEQKNQRRMSYLVKHHYSSISLGDDAMSRYKVAKATLLMSENQLKAAKQKLSTINIGDLQEAKATVNQAKLNLAYTKIYAPSDGYIANYDLRQGAKVSAYQPVFAIVEGKSWWITANYKETDLAHLHTGQQAVIQLDMYPQHKLKGTVEHIGHASGTTFSIMPAENGSGNWVKVTQRFPVRIKIKNSDPNFPLRAGASATVTINTRHSLK
ncbi:MAG: HlyD family secretion protein [Gammaproteobacteria bacterium]|nr:HlyD family secretion protein [Gammaproteobacteria bacterium]